MTDEAYKPLMSDYDNLCPVIACHWGPNAFGFVFVSKKLISNVKIAGIYRLSFFMCLTFLMA